MAGRIFCSLMLLLSVGAKAADQPPDPPVREAGKTTGHATTSAAARRRMLYHLSEGVRFFLSTG